MRPFHDILQVVSPLWISIPFVASSSTCTWHMKHSWELEASKLGYSLGSHRLSTNSTILNGTRDFEYFKVALCHNKVITTNDDNKQCSVQFGNRFPPLIPDNFDLSSFTNALYLSQYRLKPNTVYAFSVQPEDGTLHICIFQIGGWNLSVCISMLE